MKPINQHVNQILPGRSPDDRHQILADLQSHRAMARAWSLGVPERQRSQAAWAFIKIAMDDYIAMLSSAGASSIRVTPPDIALGFSLDKSAEYLARGIAQEASKLSTVQACYQLSATYTVLVPESMRSALGMYYTPPVLADRLLDLAEEAGIDWRTARILDPACGGGAFLLPVALRLRRALGKASPFQQLEIIANQLRGFEIDPFSAWLSQAWLEIGLNDLLAKTSKRLPAIVQVCDALAWDSPSDVYDLVIGNPPYGRVALAPERRRRFARSLYGHANLYGVFTDLALRWTRPGGVIAYVTPTSFLAGEYFKALRSLLATEAPPIAVEFIDARRGVFHDVLQEAVLATYRRSGPVGIARVHYLKVSSETSAQITSAGHFAMPAVPSAPWTAPRIPDHQVLVDRLARMRHRLADWGYRVSTGPLVWNRHKDQLRVRLAKSTYPLVWAEAVTSDGCFIHRAEKRNHLPYFQAKEGDDWLKVRTPCVLVQRTTAKEQQRRLIATALPAQFVRKYGAVVVENHLNMILPVGKRGPKVSQAALTAFLNSSVADEAFRCISGSVAVSAFELEALPVPPPAKMTAIEALIRRSASTKTVDAHIRALYQLYP
jgi:adenine-specific DNA-methyltransferase